MTEYVINASASRSGLFCFCPYIDEKVITGLNVFQNEPPKGGKLVAVIHAGGDMAADAWYQQHKEIVDRMVANNP